MKTQSQLDLIPHYKLHIEDLTECKKSEEGNNWLLDIGNRRTLGVKFVWLQGEITEIHEDFVLLSDSTGSCRIMASSAIQSSNSWLSPGNYYNRYHQILHSNSNSSFFKFSVCDKLFFEIQYTNYKEKIINAEKCA
jgi:hypothetical protein